MQGPHAGWSDERVEQTIGGLLRWGVLIAAAVAIVGALAFVAHHGGQPADFRAFRGVDPGLETVGGVAAGVRALRPAAVMQLALLLLIGIPIFRVALSLLAFIGQRDRTYVAITLVVLGLLLWSLLGPGGT